MRFRFLTILAAAAVMASSAPSIAAPADSGADFSTGSGTAYVQDGRARTFGGYFSSYGSNGSYLSAGLGAAGNYGGVNYVSTFTFTPGLSYLYDPRVSSSPLPYVAANLTLGAASVAGTPTFNVLLYTGQPGSLANLSTAYSTIMSNSFQVGTFAVGPNNSASFNLGSSVVAAMNQAAGTYGRTVTLAFTSGTGGAGVPGPVAGAGLPLLLAAGLAYLARRRSGALGAFA